MKPYMETVVQVVEAVAPHLVAAAEAADAEVAVVVDAEAVVDAVNDKNNE